ATGLTDHHDVGRREPGSDVEGMALRRAEVGEQRIADRLREHHVGAEIREQLGAVRARDTGGEIDDANVAVDHGVARVNIGTTTDLPGTVENASGRNVTCTGSSARSVSGPASTRYVGIRTAGSSTSATSAVTNGTRSANAGRNARRTVAQENNVPAPETATHVSSPSQCGH